MKSSTIPKNWKIKNSDNLLSVFSSFRWWMRLWQWGRFPICSTNVKMYIVHMIWSLQGFVPRLHIFLDIIPFWTWILLLFWILFASLTISKCGFLHKGINEIAGADLSLVCLVDCSCQVPIFGSTSFFVFFFWNLILVTKFGRDIGFGS